MFISSKKLYYLLLFNQIMSNKSLIYSKINKLSNKISKLPSIQNSIHKLSQPHQTQIPSIPTLPQQSIQQEQLIHQTNHYLKNGKFIYFNMNQNQQIENFIKPFTPHKQTKRKHQQTYFGCNLQKLSIQQKQSLNYVNSQLKLKQQEDKTILRIKSKYVFATDADRLKSKEQRIKVIQKIRIKQKQIKKQEARYSLERKNSSFEDQKMNKDKLQLLKYANRLNNILKSSLEQKSKKKRYSSQINQQKVNQTSNKLIDMKNFQIQKWLRQSKKEYKNKRLPNLIEIYNIPYSEYLRTKKQKQINKNALARSGISNSTKQSLLQLCQNKLLNQLQVSPKYKQKVLHIFQNINKQTNKAHN